jgi:hypothetical protein
MSQADFSSADAGRAVFIRKQTANIYTMMLIMAFLAVCVGCLFLVLEMNAYDGVLKPHVPSDAKASSVPQVQEVTLLNYSSPTVLTHAMVS